MSLRPRFGDGGLLRRPSSVRKGARSGDLLGQFAANRDWDPFERTDSGLLLAEDFARADLATVESACEWSMRCGAIDLLGAYAREFMGSYSNWEPTRDTFVDGFSEIGRQQSNVRWLLLSLARLSQGVEAWEPGWLEIVIEGTWGRSRLGVEDDQAVHLAGDEKPPVRPSGPSVWVFARPWNQDWSALGTQGEDPPDVERAPLAATRDGHIELLRRLLEPHVRVAAQFEVELPWPGPEYPLVVSERRRWRSVLSPIYLQLLEGLRRITEGQRGASFCRECGQPFLTLDSRRSSFCTDKDRFRFTQRERRKRIDRERAAHDAIAKLQSLAAEAASGEPEP